MSWPSMAISGSTRSSKQATLTEAGHERVEELMS